MYTLDPAQDGERQVTLRRSGGAPLLVAAYHVPAGSHPDFAAVEMLAQVLGDVPSGRLHKQLTDMGLTVGYMTPRQLGEREHAYTRVWTRIIQDSGFQPQ